MLHAATRTLSFTVSIAFLFFCQLSIAQNEGANIRSLSEYESGQLFSITGSNTLGSNLVPQWSKLYLEQLGAANVQIVNLDTENEYRIQGRINNSNISIKVAAHGSSTGFRALDAKLSDIAMSSRKIKTSEIHKLSHLGDMRKPAAEHVVAIDGLAVLVHPENPVNSLSIDNIAAIFSGEITNWSSVGGPNLEIQRYARDENSGTWDTFKNLVLNGKKLHPKTIRFESNDHLSDMVSANRAAIGFSGLASVRDSKAVAVSDGYTLPLPPALMHVATEDYPLSRRLYLYTPENVQNPRIKDFIQFVQHQNAQEIVKQIGFISLNPFLASINEDSDAPEAYKNIMKFSQRLSINFRFRSGSAELDNRALRDIKRVAQFMDSQEQKLRIQLIGFGDLKQKESRAILLSKLRASAVQIAFYRAGIASESVLGFGTRMPIASNLGQNKIKNQRVEVWVFNEEHREAVAKIKKDAVKQRQDGTETISSLF